MRSHGKRWATRPQEGGGEEEEEEEIVFAYIAMHECMDSDIRRGVNEIFVLLGSYAA